MTTQVGIGFSQITDPRQAGRQAAEQALKPLAGQTPHLVILFSTNDRDPEQVLGEVRATLGDVPLIGGSSEGVIVPQGALRSGAAVLALRSDEVQVITDMAPDFSQNPTEAGRSMVERLWARRNMTVPAADSLLVTVVDIGGSGDSPFRAVQVMGDALQSGCQMVGGGVQDPSGRFKCPVFHNGQACSDAIAGALLLTPGTVGMGVRHGYKPLGRPLHVTRAQGNTLYELDGRTAFEAYVEQFPNHPDLTLENFRQFALNYPLGLPQAEQEYIVRDPYAATPDGALLCAGMLPEGAQVQIMIGDRSTLVRSAREAAAEAMRSLKGRQPLLALAFSCVSRLSYLGPTAPVEIASLRAVIGSSTPLFGLFSFGEIAARPGSPAHIQNKTVSVGIISET